MTIKLLGQGSLYEINRNRQRWLTNAERRKAFLIVLAIFTVIAVGIFAWILQS